MVPYIVMLSPAGLSQDGWKWKGALIVEKEELIDKHCGFQDRLPQRRKSDAKSSEFCIVLYICPYKI